MVAPTATVRTKWATAMASGATASTRAPGGRRWRRLWWRQRLRCVPSGLRRWLRGLRPRRERLVGGGGGGYGGANGYGAYQVGYGDGFGGYGLDESAWWEAVAEAMVAPTATVRTKWATAMASGATASTR